MVLEGHGTRKHQEHVYEKVTVLEIHSRVLRAAELNIWPIGHPIVFQDVLCFDGLLNEADFGVQRQL